MKEIYVHTLRYRYYGRGGRRSSIMFPISYGPFKDEDAAWEWIRQRGIVRATKVMYAPAKENITVSHSHPVDGRSGSQAGFLPSRLKRNIIP